MMHKKRALINESLVLAILLYCAETWPVTEANKKCLEGFTITVSEEY